MDGCFLFKIYNVVYNKVDKKSVIYVLLLNHVL